MDEENLKGKKPWYLEQANFFEALNPIQIQEIEKIATIERYEKGTVICRVDDPCEFVYILKKGTLKMFLLSLDGKEIKEGDENRTTVSTAKWSADGTSLVIHSKRTFNRDGQSFESTSDETWILGKDGKTLTIQSKFTSQRGETSMKLVYNQAS